MAGHKVRTTLLVLGATLLMAPVFAFTAFGAAVSWTGCFLECSEPDRGLAVGYAAVAALCLAVPVLVGVTSARSSRGPLLWWTVGLVTVVVGAALAGQLVGAV